MNDGSGGERAWFIPGQLDKCFLQFYFLAFFFFFKKNVRIFFYFLFHYF